MAHTFSAIRADTIVRAAMIPLDGRFSSTSEADMGESSESGNARLATRAPVLRQSEAGLGRWRHQNV